MRKHDVRKWLHAVLDLLPVILIPVFMVYSHRHDVTENVQVQYKYESNEVNTLDDLVEGNIYQLDTFNIYSGETTDECFLNILQCSSIVFDTSVYTYTEPPQINDYVSSVDNYLYVDFSSVDEFCYLLFTNENANIQYCIEEGFDITFSNVIFQVLNPLETFKDFLDLQGYLPQYTDYNVIESVDIENTDVMDSFMNHFNNTIDKHFNMGNVFNLNGVYQWFNTNIFNGNAPQVIFSIWNIALYELVMDLLFLLYGLFMWFIDMVQKLMDKPLNSVK